MLQAFADAILYNTPLIADTECIQDFITEIIPVIEKLFENRKASIRRRYTKKKK